MEFVISVVQANEAIRRNPLLPEGCLRMLGFTEYLLGRYENAIATFSKIAKLEPISYACLAACYAQLGCIEETKQAAAKFSDQNEIRIMNRSDWSNYWRRKLNLNFKDQAPVDHLIDGLDKAGLVAHCIYPVRITRVRCGPMNVKSFHAELGYSNRSL